ncbi:twin-arginine translocation signal domain-containing protein [Hyphomonas sp.]
MTSPGEPTLHRRHFLKYAAGSAALAGAGALRA